MSSHTVTYVSELYTNQIERTSSFQIHGNNAANDASQGCIITPRTVRGTLNSGDYLEVVR